MKKSRTLTIDQFCKSRREYERGDLLYQGKWIRAILTDTPEFDPKSEIFHILCEPGMQYTVGRDAILTIAASSRLNK